MAKEKKEIRKEKMQKLRAFYETNLGKKISDATWYRLTANFRKEKRPVTEAALLSHIIANNPNNSRAYQTIKDIFPPEDLNIKLEQINTLVKEYEYSLTGRMLIFYLRSSNSDVPVSRTYFHSLGKKIGIDFAMDKILNQQEIQQITARFLNHCAKKRIKKIELDLMEKAF